MNYELRKLLPILLLPSYFFLLNLHAGSPVSGGPSIPVTSGLIKGDGAGSAVEASAGTDYLAPNGSGAALTDLPVGHALSVYAAGTAYAVTTASAALDFGTTDPILTIDQAGTYLIYARVCAKTGNSGVTANYVLTLKLRRTNNTAADLPNSTITPINYRGDGIGADFGSYSMPFPAVLYTTANANDTITIFGGADTITTGEMSAHEASIVAVRIY